MRKFFTIVFAMGLYFLQGQNVGIGTANPTEKLDVNGNISTNGKIKLNGDFGSPGEVMTIDQSGNPSWSSNCQYKYFRIISSSLPVNVPIDPGVSELLIEQLGPGGGGAKGGGGGSGNLLRFLVNTEKLASIDIYNGHGGIAAQSEFAGGANGDTSYIKFNYTGGGIVTYLNRGGDGANNTEAGGTQPFLQLILNNELISFEMISGQAGRTTTYTVAEYGTGLFGQFFSGGHGGNPPVFGGGGGSGGAYGRDLNTNMLLLTEARRPTPGTYGGGGGYYASTIYGRPGGGGITIIRWN